MDIAMRSLFLFRKCLYGFGIGLPKEGDQPLLK